MPTNNKPQYCVKCGGFGKHQCNIRLNNADNPTFPTDEEVLKCILTSICSLCDVDMRFLECAMYHKQKGLSQYQYVLVKVSCCVCTHTHAPRWLYSIVRTVRTPSLILIPISPLTGEYSRVTNIFNLDAQKYIIVGK
jgi:hypothetical protein